MLLNALTFSSLISPFNLLVLVSVELPFCLVATLSCNAITLHVEYKIVLFYFTDFSAALCQP